MLFRYPFFYVSDQSASYVTTAWTRQWYAERCSWLVSQLAVSHNTGPAVSDLKHTAYARLGGQCDRSDSCLNLQPTAAYKLLKCSFEYTFMPLPTYNAKIQVEKWTFA